MHRTTFAACFLTLFAAASDAAWYVDPAFEQFGFGTGVADQQYWAIDAAPSGDVYVVPTINSNEIWKLPSGGGPVEVFSTPLAGDELLSSVRTGPSGEVY